MRSLSSPDSTREGGGRGGQGKAHSRVNDDCDSDSDAALHNTTHDDFMKAVKVIMLSPYVRSLSKNMLFNLLNDLFYIAEFIECF